MNESNGGDVHARNTLGDATIGVSVQAGAVHGDVHLHHGSPVQAVVPRQLPGSVRHFVNRAVEQDALTTLLNAAPQQSGSPQSGSQRSGSQQGGTQHDTTATAGTVLIGAVDGTAGVGKSTLVVHWAHRMRDHFPDGELYVNLRGFDPLAEPMSANDALASFLSALDIPAERIPEDVDARSALLRSLLHGKRMLLVLDNASTGEQIRPLLPGNDSSLVVVTSRNRLDELLIGEGAARISLTVLTAAEAHELLTRHLGASRLDAEPDAVERLVEHCAGLPLALGIAAARVAENPDFPLDGFVDELNDERERLDALDAGGQTGIRAVFSWSYRRLSPRAARMFRLLGLPTGPDISLAAAADLAGTEPREARRLLAELTRAHLVEQHEPGRYRFHDLLRAYAAECAVSDETQESRLEAHRRLLDHYLRTSAGISKRLLAHTRYYFPEAPESDITGLDFADEQDGMRWWDAERANLTAAIRSAARVGLHEHAWQLPLSLMTFFHIRSHVDDWLACHSIGLDAARHVEEHQGEAYLSHELGIAHYEASKYHTAAVYWQQAFELFRAEGNHSGKTDALIGMGNSRIETAELEAATELFHEAWDLAVEHTDRYHQGQARFGLGRVHLAREDFDQAAPRFEEALEHYEHVGETYGRGYALNMLADSYTGSGRISEAIETYHHALDQFRNLGHRLGEATVLRGLGTALLSANGSNGKGVGTNGNGSSASGSGTLGSGTQESAIQGSGGSHESESSVRTRLDTREPATTEQCWQQALAILDELGHPDANDVRTALAELT